MRGEGVNGKTETDLNGRPLPRGDIKKGEGVSKTETDLNGRPLSGGKGRGQRSWGDRDGPKWPAPVNVEKRGGNKYNRDGPKRPAQDLGGGWEETNRDGPKWPAPACGKRGGSKKKQRRT